MENQGNKAKRKLTAGQWVGLAISGIALIFPAIFWGITYWRDLTKTYCEGECLTGWLAVLSTLAAIPTLAIGLAVLGISTALKSGRESKPEGN